MDADAYLALVTIHGTIMVFFVLTAGLSWVPFLGNPFLIPPANRSERYGLLDL
ncbi:hypothetical protein CCAN12_690037 [Capnocytophaga canimorsus]|uniref:Uncharacterized protein n=1 Tax=Capnocytophaga canimorsus TaxID=28188 RepID=A0A0B7HC59_9FLAO|nr:hypothetical protein [Capnocytophaga canimorsus]CEN37261.1 hypothetical protein CCAN12_690037 [Capnocytophaga canimorsus]